MRFLRVSLIFIFLSLALSYPTMAQRQAKEKPAPKIAFFDARLFADEKQGISIYTKALKQIDIEFQPVINELIELSDKVKKLQDEIEELLSKCALVNCGELTIFGQKINEQKQLVDLYAAKSKPAEVLYKKRRDDVVKPIEEDIGKELTVFVKEKGFTYVIDKLTNFWPCFLEYKESDDITKEFIAYYNAKHPVAVTIAKPQM